MNWESLIKQNQLSLSYKLNFGKHKGKTINEILEEEPTYIRWCVENICWFKLSEKDEKKVHSLSDDYDREIEEEYHDWGALDCIH